MPAIVAPALATSALGTGAAIGAGIGGAGLALGGGLAAGTALAGGTGLAGLLGGLGGAGAGAAGSMLGGAAITPTVASLAPAATAQAMGPSMLQSAGLDALKSQAIGGGMLPGASQGLASTLPGAVNPTLAQQIAQQQTVANAARQNLLAQSGGTDIMGGAGQQAFQQAHTVSGPGLNKNALQMPSLSNPTVSPLSTTQAANPADIVGRSVRPDQNFMQNLGNIGSFQDVKDYAEVHPYATSAMAGLGAMGISKMLQPKKIPTPEDESMIRPYTYERTQRPEAYGTSPTMDSSERSYFNDQFVAGEPYKAAEGGIAAAYAVGGPVEQMAAMNAVGANTGYPMANLQTPVYANPAMQRPEATNVIAPSVDAGVGAYSGEARFAKGGEAEGGYKYSYDPKTMQFTQQSVPEIKTPTIGQYGNIISSITTPVTNSGNKISGGIATPAVGPMQAQQSTPINIPAYQSPEQQLGLTGFYDMMNQQLGGYGGYAKGGNVGGESHLGDYSDGGRLLKGPGDGVSDSIPASIGGRQPARLADGEFVIPARIVSELGNGSTEAGARKLYAMMERVQATRRKSIGKKKVAVNSKADKHLPA